MDSESTSQGMTFEAKLQKVALTIPMKRLPEGTHNPRSFSGYLSPNEAKTLHELINGCSSCNLITKSGKPVRNATTVIHWLLECLGDEFAKKTEAR